MYALKPSQSAKVHMRVCAVDMVCTCSKIALYNAILFQIYNPILFQIQTSLFLIHPLSLMLVMEAAYGKISLPHTQPCGSLFLPLLLHLYGYQHPVQSRQLIIWESSSLSLSVAVQLQTVWYIKTEEHTIYKPRVSVTDVCHSWEESYL